MMIEAETQKMTRKRRFGILLITMAIFSIVFQAGSYIEVSEQEAIEFIKQFEEAIIGIDGIAIFLHNTVIALGMFIPFVGAVYGNVVSLQTGWAVSAATVINPELEQIPAVALLFLSPFGLMELFAYGLGISRSFLLAITIVKRQSLKAQLRPTLIEIGIVVSLLFVGGIIEFEMLKWASEAGFSIIEAVI